MVRRAMRMWMARAAVGGAFAAFLLAAVIPSAAAQEPSGAWRVGKLFTCRDGQGPIDDGLLVVQGGKIAYAGPHLAERVPHGMEVDHRRSAWCLPGFVEAHAHVGTMNRGDYNEMNHISNPELRVADMASFGWVSLKRSLMGGVTTILFIPGSGTTLSGFGAIIKTGAKGPGDGMLREIGAVKIAHAFNPRRSIDFGSTLMGLTWTIREALRRGEEYAKSRRGKDPDDREGLKPELENIRQVLERQVPAIMHTQYFQVVQGSVRVCNDEFGIDAFIGHGTFDAFLNAPYVKKLGVPVINGPRQIYLSPKTGRIHGCAAEWYHRGIEEVGLNTDSPVVPQEELPFQATMACWMGLPTEVALLGLTIVPARAIGMAHRVGSLEKGKDADFVLWSGNPIDPRSAPREVFIDGRSVYREGLGPLPRR